MPNRRFSCPFLIRAVNRRHPLVEAIARIDLVRPFPKETDVARQSQLFRDYLRTSAAFWDYSWHNQMLIWRQKPDASFVGGFNTWLKCGRYVRKGEKGIAILAPMFFKDKRQTTDGVDAETQRIWFKVVYVFDRLSRDLRPSLCVLDGIRECHFRKSPR